MKSFSEKTARDAVVIGASAGGLEALEILLAPLTAEFSAAVILVLHLDHDTRSLVDLLGSRTQLRVGEAVDREPILAGSLYLAPPRYHLLVEPERTFSLSLERHVHHARPSIDVLFDTAADAYGPRLTGVILSGGGSDGGAGLRRVRDGGGLCLIQDPVTAGIPEMPQLAIGAVEGEARVLSPSAIGALLRRRFSADVTG